MPLAALDAEPVTGARRDGVDGVDGTPTIVSVSDVHGYLEPARSALQTLTDHPDYDPIVEADEDGRLHWAGENYVLLFNGDLIDRGPDNEAVLALVARLLEEAPPGRVRVTLGNHEMGVLVPDRFGWRRWYSGKLDTDGRRAFLAQIAAGHVIAAYEGYNVRFSHAGHPDPYDPATANEALIEAAERLAEHLDEHSFREVQSAVIEEYPLVLGLGGTTGRGNGAGLAWLDFGFLPADAPPQVVGHTRHEEVTQEGNVICQNVIRNNLHRDGGEAVVLDTPAGVSRLRRQPDGSVDEQSFEIPTADGT